MSGAGGTVVILFRRAVRRGTLGYDVRLDHFCLDVGGEWAPIQMGEAVVIRFKNRYIWGSMLRDPDGGWYLLFPSLRGIVATILDLRTDCRYDARCIW